MSKAARPKPVAATATESSHTAELAKRTVERRAVEAAIWGMPIVSVEAMRRAFFGAGARYGDILYLSKPADWKFQTTTPNASSLYVYFNFNTKDGPVVLDFPAAMGAGLFGTLLDAWQVPLADVGPEGEDKGRGGKYLIVPPGHEDVPKPYIPVRPGTYNGYALFRAIPKTSSDADRSKAIELVKKLRLYPLSRANAPPPQRHIDIAGKLFDGIVRYDDTFYDALARVVGEEPAHERDLAAAAQLKSLGIDAGKPFAPDKETRQILNAAIGEAHAGFMAGVEAITPYWPGKRWGLHDPVGPETAFSFIGAGGYALDQRAMTYFLAYAPPKKLGAATFYISSLQDAGGAALQGSETYRLRVPPNAPASQYWSMTVYDLETAGFIREAPRVAVDSYQNTQKNADGSIDIFLGRAPPPGKESNWIYTAPGRRWFSMFRFYGPQKAVFDKTWALPDIERTS